MLPCDFVPYEGSLSSCKIHDLQDCNCTCCVALIYFSLFYFFFVRSQATDSEKANVEQGEFNEELSKWESRLPL
jgi:hypothetical protein